MEALAESMGGWSAVNRIVSINGVVRLSATSNYKSMPCTDEVEAIVASMNPPQPFFVVRSRWNEVTAVRMQDVAGTVKVRVMFRNGQDGPWHHWCIDWTTTCGRFNTVGMHAGRGEDYERHVAEVTSKRLEGMGFTVSRYSGPIPP